MAGGHLGAEPEATQGGGEIFHPTEITSPLCLLVVEGEECAFPFRIRKVKLEQGKDSFQYLTIFKVLNMNFNLKATYVLVITGV